MGNDPKRPGVGCRGAGMGSREGRKPAKGMVVIQVTTWGTGWSPVLLGSKGDGVGPTSLCTSQGPDFLGCQRGHFRPSLPVWPQQNLQAASGVHRSAELKAPGMWAGHRPCLPRWEIPGGRRHREDGEVVCELDLVDEQESKALAGRAAKTGGWNKGARESWD